MFDLSRLSTSWPFRFQGTDPANEVSSDQGPELAETEFGSQVITVTNQEMSVVEPVPVDDGRADLGSTSTLPSNLSLTALSVGQGWQQPNRASRLGMGVQAAGGIMILVGGVLFGYSMTRSGEQCTHENNTTTTASPPSSNCDMSFLPLLLANGLLMVGSFGFGFGYWLTHARNVPAIDPVLAIGSQAPVDEPGESSQEPPTPPPPPSLSVEPVVSAPRCPEGVMTLGDLCRQMRCHTQAQAHRPKIALPVEIDVTSIDSGIEAN